MRVDVRAQPAQVGRALAPHRRGAGRPPPPAGRPRPSRSMGPTTTRASAATIRAARHDAGRPPARPSPPSTRRAAASRSSTASARTPSSSASTSSMAGAARRSAAMSSPPSAAACGEAARSASAASTTGSAQPVCQASTGSSTVLELAGDPGRSPTSSSSRRRAAAAAWRPRRYGSRNAGSPVSAKPRTLLSWSTIGRPQVAPAATRAGSMPVSRSLRTSRWRAAAPAGSTSVPASSRPRPRRAAPRAACGGTRPRTAAVAVSHRRSRPGRRDRHQAQRHVVGQRPAIAAVAPRPAARRAGPPQVAPRPARSSTRVEQALDPEAVAAVGGRPALDQAVGVQQQVGARAERDGAPASTSGPGITPSRWPCSPSPSGRPGAATQIGGGWPASSSTPDRAVRGDRQGGQRGERQDLDLGPQEPVEDLQHAGLLEAGQGERPPGAAEPGAPARPRPARGRPRRRSSP